ncbi:MAG: tetratricopeptide repeat protein [Desulfobacterales bacterium]|nr:tetratricopeptide repeat protein [Desulfobacterales bacterium]
MNFIKEIIRSMKCGGYSGKGHKYTRNEDYNNALACYQKALSYSDNEGGSINIIECIARSYARLDNLDMALSEAEKCLSLLNNIDSPATVFTDAKNRVVFFIEALKRNDIEKIKEMITI